MSCDKNSLRTQLDAGAGTCKRSIKSAYGCVEWQPDSIGDGETKESQEQKQKLLKEEFAKSSEDRQKVDRLMKATYASQHFEINKTPTVPLSELQESWPFFFSSPYFENHFYQLTGTVAETFQTNLSQKGKPLFDFFCKEEQARYMVKWATVIEEAKRSTQNDQCHVVAAIIMLCEYFGEKMEFLLKEVKEETDLSGYVNAVSSPCLIFAGTNPFLTNRLAITIDQKRLIFSSSMLNALKLLVMAFYVFNISYPKEVQATLEFIQRIFFEIRPEKGTKAKRSYRWIVNPKVRSFCEKVNF